MSICFNFAIVPSCYTHLIYFLFWVRQVAGAAAAAGLSLAEVAAEARYASQNVGTMGVALKTCTLPGRILRERLGPSEMELGLGIVSFL